jgi:lipid A disaccharide synthetase
LRQRFSSSLDLDAGLADQYPNEPRWDYLLGLDQPRSVVAVEPHGARNSEVERVIAKKRSAVRQLREHLKSGERIERWFWVSHGKSHFADTERIRLILDQNGIEFVSRQLIPKHLD